MVKNIADTSDDEINIAKSRGERAAKLFDKVENKTMRNIIKALKQEDLHVADPSQPSGKSEFYAECWKAIPLKLFSINEQTDADKAAFIDDLWKTAVASRKAQSTVPCW
jgi:hypothetical protein